MEVLICPFCDSIFLQEYDAGDECPECELGVLISFDEYLERISSSFGEAFSFFRGSDE